MKPNQKRIVILALSLGLVGYGVLRAIPLFIDREAIKIAIEEGLHESTGVNFKIQELKLEPTVWHGIQVYLNTTAITDLRHHPLGGVGNISIQIRYWPLITNQLPEIAKIHLNHVRVPVGEYSLFRSLKLKLVKPKQTGFLKPAEMKNTEILLTDYLLEDIKPAATTRKILPAVRRFRVEGQDLSVRHLLSDKPIALLGTGQLAYQVQGAGITGNARNPLATYKLFLEIPQAATQKKQVSAEDLARLELGLRGKPLNLKLDYKHLQNHAAEGRIQSVGLDLLQAQVLALQLGNTIGLPVPKSLSQAWLSGVTRLDSRFNLVFRNGQPVLTGSSGDIQLLNLALTPDAAWPNPVANRMNGLVRLEDDLISLENLQAVVEGLPVRVKGSYHLNNQQISADITANRLQVDSLKKTFVSLGTGPNPLQGRNVNGLLDVNAKIRGTAQNPSYQGVIGVRNGAFTDTSQGIEANHVNGNVAFRGKGLKNPLVAYQGRLSINDGKLIVASQGLAVNRFDGQMQFKGNFQPNAKTPALPTMEGLVNVREADYKDPKTGIPVTGIQGALRLAGDLIHIENFKALLAGSELHANGQLATDFKQYRVRLTGQNLDIPRLKRDVLTKLPGAQTIASQINPYSGRANLDLTASTGINLNGRIDVNTLALKSPKAKDSLRIPLLSLRFDRERITLPDTTVLYGPVAAHLNGNFTAGGAYNVHVDSGDVPMSFIRDNQSTLASLADVSLPEIWNTAGNMSLKGTLANRATDLTLNFVQAGLSWEGGDFPVYDLNGVLAYRQAGQGKPVIDSRGLTMKYANSPVVVRARSAQDLNVHAEGVLSALAVNHFLVSSQSNAMPYQEVPFQLNLNGLLAAAPGQPAARRNNLKADLHLDLNKNFREAYQETPPPSQPEKSDKQQVKEAAAVTSAIENDQPAPDIVSNAKDRKRLKIENINAVNTLTKTVNIVQEGVELGKNTLGLGVNVIKKPATFITQKVILNPAHELIDTKNRQAPSVQTANQPTMGATPAEMADKDNAFLDANVRLLGENLLLDKALLHLFDGGDVLASGKVTHLDRPAALTYETHVQTSPDINLHRLSKGAAENSFFQKADGTLGMDIHLLGNGAGEKKAFGWLATNQLAIPYLTLQDVTGRVDLNGESAIANVPSFKIPGVTTRVNARTENIFESPVTLEDVDINGSFLSIDSLTEFNDKIIKPVIVDQIVHNYLRPWQQGDPTSPVQFRDANLHVDEAIYQNIIMNNLNSKFSVNSNSFFELTNTSLEAAGGRVTGYLSMSPNDASFTTLELNADQVKANALTKALLNVTNQIFGDLSGTVRFTTYGLTDVDMQKNANGTVSMKITNGRLPAIAKVETLLATANVIRGGLLGFNLNNLFRSLTIYDTNYFAELSGDMLINNQILYTQNLVSDGVNLDLLIQGSLRMDNGNANMLVNGRMSQDVAGKLGKLGNLSLGQLVHYIPALGNFGKNQGGLLSYIPGVGYVPGFGGPAGKYNRFQVHLLGQLEDPSAIQDFHWVRPQNL